MTAAPTERTPTSEPTLEVVQVTPQLAQEWLLRNEGNRPIQMHTVENYARLMADGLWELNGDTIRFDTDNILRDGQHRLAACVRANVTFTALVVHGIAARSQATMDQGRKRTANDILGMNGIVNGAAIASTARMLHQWKSGTRLIGDFKNSGRNQLSASEVLDWASQDELLARANQVAGRTGMRAICNPRASSTLWYLCHEADADKCDDFFTALESGAGLKLGDPALTLRNHWQNLRVQGSKAPAAKYFSSGVRAWNKFVKGQALSFIAQRAEREVPDLLIPSGKEDTVNRWATPMPKVVKEPQEPISKAPATPSATEVTPEAPAPAAAPAAAKATAKPKPSAKKVNDKTDGGAGSLFRAR